MDPHYERNLIVNNKLLNYTGIFRLDSLLETINKELVLRGYTLREKKSEELVTEEGRKLSIELRPYKTRKSNAQTDVRLQLAIRITIDHLKDKIEEANGYLHKFQEADVVIAIDAWVLADDKFEDYMNPVRYFTRSLISKYIVDISLHKGKKEEVAADAKELRNKIKKFFNTYTDEKKIKPIEADIMGEVAEDIRKLARHEDQK